MGVVEYLTIDGEIVSEIRDGVERDYVSDPLGSTVALLDGSQNQTDTFTYWPYGTRTGTTPTPFQYVGSLGYYRDNGDRDYVRARSLSKKYGRWLTVDPLWPGVPSYGVSNGSPCSVTDQSGAGPALAAAFMLRENPKGIHASAKGCRVWRCYARRVFSHACIDVETPTQVCGGSRDPWSFYSCAGAHLQPREWDCHVVSSDCNFAHKVCDCISEEWSEGSPFLEWCRHIGCWGFAVDMLCCACHRLPEAQRSGCEMKFCAPAYCPSLSPPPPSGLIGGGAGGRYPRV